MIYVGGRTIGKTEFLINEAIRQWQKQKGNPFEKEPVIITFSEYAASCIRSRLVKKGFPNIEVITLKKAISTEYTNGFGQRIVRKAYIDELDTSVQCELQNFFELDMATIGEEKLMHIPWRAKGEGEMSELKKHMTEYAEMGKEIIERLKRIEKKIDNLQNNIDYQKYCKEVQREQSEQFNSMMNALVVNGQVKHKKKFRFLGGENDVD